MFTPFLACTPYPSSSWACTPCSSSFLACTPCPHLPGPVPHVHRPSWYPTSIPAPSGQEQPMRQRLWQSEASARAGPVCGGSCGEDLGSQAQAGSLPGQGGRVLLGVPTAHCQRLCCPSWLLPWGPQLVCTRKAAGQPVDTWPLAHNVPSPTALRTAHSIRFPRSSSVPHPGCPGLPLRLFLH